MLSRLAILLLSGGLITILHAQQTVSAAAGPGLGGAIQTPNFGAAQPQSFGDITGAVRDADGAAAPGIPVTLTGQDNAVNRVETTDEQGAFMFAALPPGTYRVKIKVAGVEPFVSAAVVLGAGEKRQLPGITMRIAVQAATVHVTATLKK